MQLQPTQLTGLLGAIVLSAGMAAPITLADEPTESNEATETSSVAEHASDANQSSAKDDADGKQVSVDDDTIEVRISMPDGRIIIRREKVRNRSDHRGLITPGTVSRVLADGSRISYGRAGVSGGSNSGSGRSLGSGSGGGGGGGGRSSGGGGGGGSGISSGSGSSGSGAALSGGGSLDSASLARESSESATEGQSDAQAGVSTGTTLFTGAGIYSSSGSSSSDGSESGSSESSSSSTDSASTRTDTTPSTDSSTDPVSTIGAPQYSQGGAVGGQRVEFHDAGIGASVVGNTIYFVGVELVQANQVFEVVTGTRVGADSVIMQDDRPQGSSDTLNTWSVGESRVMLDFDSGTTVDLVMLSEPEDSSNPNRDVRTWRVRIR
jgi:hypothetical protein